MATRETQSQRLDRIEDKIDKLSDAMVSLARAEEKLIAIEKNNHSSLERMNRFSQKLDDIEKVHPMKQIAVASVIQVIMLAFMGFSMYLIGVAFG